MSESVCVCEIERAGVCVSVHERSVCGETERAGVCVERQREQECV
jgi:hypothetical protein